MTIREDNVEFYIRVMGMSRPEAEAKAAPPVPCLSSPWKPDSVEDALAYLDQVHPDEP